MTILGENQKRFGPPQVVVITIMQGIFNEYGSKNEQ